MFTRRFLLRLSVAFLILLTSVAVLALPETAVQTSLHAKHGVCWCGCDKMMGHARCLKMCELPKYENRSWATTCHKPTLTLSPAPTRAPATPLAKPTFRTSRHYRYLYAQNQSSPKPGTPR
jgi:hypothetical protein